MRILVTGIGGLAGPPGPLAPRAGRHGMPGRSRPPPRRPPRPRPLTGGAASEEAADLAAAEWARAYGLDVVRARAFSHTGPGQDAAFVCAALAREIACIEAGRQEAVVHAGNLDPVRDFS